MRDLCTHPVDDMFGIAVLEHDHHAQYCFSIPVLGGGAMPGLMADLDFGQVLQINRCAVFGFDHNVFKVPYILGKSLGNHVYLFPVPLYETAPRVCIIGLQNTKNFIQCNPVFDQQCRIGNDMVLFDKSPETVDLRHAREPAKLGADHPVLKGSQVHQVFIGPDHPHSALRTVCFCFAPGPLVLRTIIPALHRILIDFAKSRGNRSHLRFHPLRQIILHLGQTFKDNLPGKIDIHRVFKDDNDLRQARLR